MARFIVEDLVAQRGLTERLVCDSCGTGGWHAGGGADPRTVEVAARRGLRTAHTARMLRVPQDFEAFDWLIPMDVSNARTLLARGAPPARVRLMRSFDPALAGRGDEALIVPDPYHGGDEGFERMYEMLLAAGEGLVAELAGRAP